MKDVLFIELRGGLCSDKESLVDGKFVTDPSTCKRDLDALNILAKFTKNIDFYILYDRISEDIMNGFDMFDHHKIYAYSNLPKIEYICQYVNNKYSLGTHIHVLWGSADLLPIHKINEINDYDIGTNYMTHRHFIHLYRPLNSSVRSMHNKFVSITELSSESGNGAVDELIYNHLL